MLNLSRKGQALTELAIFGGVILGVVGYLLSYGQNYNYSENIEMTAFRKALKMAYAANNTYITSSIILIKEKPFHDSSSAFFSSERSPVIASASARWSNSLFMSYEPNQDYGNDDLLPKVTLLIAGKEYNLTTAGWITYTYACDSVTGDCPSIRKKKDDPNDHYKLDGVKCARGELSDGVCDGRYWYWMTVPITAVELNNDYDVDGDGKLETVVDKERDGDNPGPHNRLLKCLDYQEGEIDASINSQDKRNGAFPFSGLTGEYKYEREEGIPRIAAPDLGIVVKERPSKLVREENKTSIITTEVINTEDNFYYLVRLNNITGNLRGKAKGYGDRLDENAKMLWIRAQTATNTRHVWNTPK